MFGKKKQAPAPVPPSRKGAGLMQQMGFGGMSEMDDMVYGDLDDDEDLEAELMELQGEEPPSCKHKKQAAVNMNMLDKIISEGMKDIPSDEEMSDTEDPSLMAELEDLTSNTDDIQSSLHDFTPSSSTSQQTDTAMLEERIVMYMQAAEYTEEMSKKRRLERGIKTLQDLLKTARSGKPVNEEDIPPPVTVSNKQSAPPMKLPSQEASVSAGSLSSSSSSERSLPFVPTFQPTPQPALRTGPAPVPIENQHDGVEYDRETYRVLKERRDQYKQAALTAKRNNNMESATQFVKVAKQFDGVIAALEEGKPVDLSKMPPPPSELAKISPVKQSTTAPTPTPVQRSTMQAAGNNRVPAEKEPEIPQGLSEKEEQEFFKAPEAPRTVMDALQQRLAKYKHSEDTAKEAAETSKARRMSRIVKQYQDAIKSYKAGKPINPEDLPTPPGYAPIPVGAHSQGSLAPPQPTPAGAAGSASANASVSSHSLSPSPMKGQRSPSPSGVRSVAGEKTPPVAAPRQMKSISPQPATRQQQQKAASVKKSPSSRAEQQSLFLHERMEEYKMAALQAKKNRDLELAKKYMRLAKGFEPMIDASESGLPVDLAQIPPSPNAREAEAAFVVVSPDEVEISGDRDEVFKKLEQDLIQQIRTSSTANQNFTKLGDVVAAMKFQQMEQSNRKDLESLKSAFRSGDPTPQFHYENRTYSLVQCNADLGDADFELTVVRGLQYNPPSGYAEKDLDTYIKFEFPFPTDDPQTGTTETKKASLNPDYQEPFKIEISRKSRGLVRVVERKAIKIEVFYKRGFLKSDKVLGIVNVKLKPIETKCTVHDSYDLTDGKKAVGGKLEVKMRIRNPLKGREIEEVREKWLVIDKFIKVKNPTKSNPRGKLVKTTKSDGSVCMEVLKFERQQLERQISCLKDSLSPSQTQSLKNKSKLLQEKIEHQQSLFKDCGIEVWKSYVTQIEADIPDYEAEARHLAQQGDMQKAQMILTKKKMAEKELVAIRAKMPNI